ncbi:MAG TPA: GNAT family N-acetyltransferase [Massilia sp.]|nr:GNAT family N-acetyltransferase [Massilia sp.]
MKADLHLRPVRDGDEDFLRRVYASCRAAEIALAGWDAATADAFLRMQFDAQQRHYRLHYPQARHDIVEYGGVATGRLYVAREPGEIRVIDIALLDAWRGQGIGRSLLGGLLREAGTRGQCVTLHVEEDNPARTLYRRLGFIQTGTHGPYLRMAWRAQAAAFTFQDTICNDAAS